MYSILGTSAPAPKTPLMTKLLRRPVSTMASSAFGPHEFSLPFGSYVETCTSFYQFSGPTWLAGWIGYCAPTEFPPHLSTFNCWTPLPWHHYSQHTIGNECMSRFGAICSVVSTGPIFKQCKIETFVMLTSRRDGCRRCSIEMHMNDRKCDRK
jgi:hypothetical protein